MLILRWILGVLATATAALAGNWVGGQIRYMITGQTTQTIHFEHTTTTGLTMDNYPVATKFLAAL